MMEGHIDSWIPSLILNLFCTLYHLFRFLPTDADGLGRGGDIEEKEAFLFLTSLLECSAHHRRFIWKQKQTERYLLRSMLNVNIRKRSGRLIRWIFQPILVLVVHVSIALSATYYYDSKSIWRHIELFNSSSISDDSLSMCQLLILFKFFIANPLLPASFCHGQM